MKHCSLCLASFPEDSTQCRKCGGSILETNEDNLPLRKVHSFFSVAEFFTKANPPVVVNGELVAVPIEWKLYKARVQQNAPPIYLWDRDGYVVPGNPEAALHIVEGEDLAKIISEMPEKKLKEIKRSLKEEWVGLPIDEEDGNILDVFKQTPILFEPVPRLKDASILEKMNWRQYIESLVCPKPGKDEALIAVHKAKLLKPLAIKYAPHSLEITNSNTGKTSFYDASGIKIDKATSRSVLGYAKSPNEVYPGTINGTELPTAFDQLESQTSHELARYMFNIMETGRSLVDSGGLRFPVETKSSFAYLGNPVAKDAKVVEGFRALLDHLTSNPALGRRFGIILFRTDLKTIRDSDKMSLVEEEEWKRAFTLFRAVEEYALPKLREIIRDHKVAEWLHKPVKGYRTVILRATEELKDNNMAMFFEAHAEAEHRVRGAALHAAVAILLDTIALDETSVEEVLQEAEDLLNDYVEINIQSIVNLAQMWDSLRIEQAKTFFENLSEYMKEIVSAILHYKRANPECVKVNLVDIPYEPKDADTYKYFSRCINRLRKRTRLDSLNETFRNYFGFQIEGQGEVFSVLYFENPKPPEDLPLLGFIRLSDLSIYPKNQTEAAPVIEGKGMTKEDESVSENTDKRINWINGEKETKNISVTCGDCKFFHSKECVEEHPEYIQRSATYAAKCYKFEKEEK